MEATKASRKQRQPEREADEARFNAPEHYAELTAAQQMELQQWIARTFTPTSRANSRTSYGLKHDFEAVGFYVTNGQFKGAMLAAGYQPTPGTAGEVNWCFRVRIRKAGVAP
jgi:hypothetical protein